jgi:hypothetical protein
MIPDFTADELLPPGVHDCEWSELAARFAAGDLRQRQVRGLKAALDDLKVAGCGQVLVDGSFVTAKEVPGDFDVAWDITGVDPAKVDRVILDTSPTGRVAQKIKYCGELFPAQFLATSGRTYKEFFQIDKESGNPKGILRLDLRRLP